MLTVLLALSIVALGQDNKRVDSYRLPTPLMWDEHGHMKWPEGSIVNLRPRKTLKESQGVHIQTPLLDIPSFDPWVNFIDNLCIEDLAPRIAKPDTEKPIWAPWKVDRVRHQISGPRYHEDLLGPIQHCPWHVTLQIQFPHLFKKESVLFYTIIRKPFSDSLYYEAFVSSMPNIKCLGKDREELEQQLLKEYASYLSELLLSKEVVIEQPRPKKLLPAWYNCEGFFFGADFVF